MGAEISASRQSLFSSRAKLRFNSRVPAKANTIHSRPPEISRVVSSLGSKAKLNRSSTTRAKESEALMASLVRNSARKSLAIITSTCRTKAVMPLSSLTVTRVDPAGIGHHCRRTRAVKRHLAAVEQRDVRGQFQGLTQLVGGHDDSLAVGQRLAKQALQHGDGAVVERGEGFVEQQHFGPVEEGAGDCQALPHAAREFADQAVLDAIEAGALQPVQGGLLRIRDAVELAEQHQILQRRKLVVDADAVTDEAHEAARLSIAGAVAEDRDLAFAGPRKSRDGAQQGGFAGTVAANQRQAGSG